MVKKSDMCYNTLMKTIIRQWRPEDACDLAKAISNLHVQNNLWDGLPYPYTESDASDYISAMLSADRDSTFAFAIEYDGRAVGSIGAFRQSNIHFRTAELGYYVAEEYWGKGIATAAVKLICSYVFENTDILRIYAEPQQMPLPAEFLKSADFNLKALCSAMPSSAAMLQI